MPSEKISQLTNGNPAQNGDLIPIARGGANFSITPASIAALAGGANFGTSGQGWFVGPGMTDLSSLFITSNNAPLTNFAADVVIVYQFVLTASWKLSSCSYTLFTASGGDHFNFGIYNAAGSKLIDCAFDGSLSTTQTITFGPTTLPPGVYYFAVSATSGGPQGPILFSSNNTTAPNLKTINAVTPLLARAANSTSGNVLPSTLGVLTAITSVAAWEGFPLPVWAV